MKRRKFFGVAVGETLASLWPQGKAKAESQEKGREGYVMLRYTYKGQAYGNGFKVTSDPKDNEKTFDMVMEGLRLNLQKQGVLLMHDGRTYREWMTNAGLEKALGKE